MALDAAKITSSLINGAQTIVDSGVLQLFGDASGSSTPSFFTPTTSATSIAALSTSFSSVPLTPTLENTPKGIDRQTRETSYQMGFAA